MNDILIPLDELAGTIEKVLLNNGFDKSRAKECALLFANTDLDGVRSHGINRFLLFLDFVKKGYVNPSKNPEIESSLGVFTSLALAVSHFAIPTTGCGEGVMAGWL